MAETRLRRHTSRPALSLVRPSYRPPTLRSFPREDRTRSGAFGFHPCTPPVPAVEDRPQHTPRRLFASVSWNLNPSSRLQIIRHSASSDSLEAGFFLRCLHEESLMHFVLVSLLAL